MTQGFRLEIVAQVLFRSSRTRVACVGVVLHEPIPGSILPLASIGLCRLYVGHRDRQSTTSRISPNFLLSLHLGYITRRLIAVDTNPTRILPRLIMIVAIIPAYMLLYYVLLCT